MSKYFEYVSDELLSKLSQVKHYIKKHNPTIGVMTEELVRGFLRAHLPSFVSVEQGFIINETGELSKQCDVIVYDSHSYAPLYRVGDIVIVPAESVLCVVEVKTTIQKQIFHSVIDYFKALGYLPNAKTFLFIFNSQKVQKLQDHFDSYNHDGDYQLFDHDTFHFLPDEITGINKSFHLKKDSVIADSDKMGYTSFFFEDMEGTAISALQLFYLSIYTHIESYLEKNYKNVRYAVHRAALNPMKISSNEYLAVELFDM